MTYIVEVTRVITQCNSIIGYLYEGLIERDYACNMRYARKPQQVLQ